MTGAAHSLHALRLGPKREPFAPARAEDAAYAAHKPTLGAPRALHRNPFYTVYRVPAEFPDGHRDYYVSADGPRAGTVLYDGARVLLVRQYRLLLDGFSYEIPGGAVAEGESPELAAARECREEAGVRPRRLVRLLRYELALDIRDNPTYLFACTDFEHLAAPRSDGETVGSGWFSLPVCLDMIFAGSICDSFTIIALLAFHEFERRG